METVLLILVIVLFAVNTGFWIYIYREITEVDVKIEFIPEWINTILDNEYKLADMEDERYEELNNRLTRIDNYIRLLQAECERK